MKHFTDALFEDIDNFSDVHQALLTAWGSRSPGNRCIFITPEGTYLNLFPKIFSHDKLCDWVEREGYGPTTKQASWFSDNLDYIRCRNNRGLSLIELPAKITTAQLDALQVWIETKVNDTTIDVGAADGQYKSYNLQDLLPEDIIKRIKRYFSSGKLYESLKETLETKIVRRDNPADFSPFGYKVDFFDDDKHIGEGSVCGVKDDNAFLYDFEVYPEFRGKGYSKPMLQFMIDKYDLKQLYVDQDNTVAINLYKKFGFVIDGEVDDDGKPAYNMVRD